MMFSGRNFPWKTTLHNRLQ